MAFADGSSHELSYVAEVTAGVTPATPAFKELRHNGTTLGLSKETLESEELGGRDVKCFKHGNKQVGGDVNSELSFSDFDDMLEAGFCGTWAADVLKTGTTRRTFTFQRFFADISTYIRHTGCEVNSIGMSVSPNAIATLDLGIVGLDQDTDNAAVALATAVAATTDCPFDSFTGTINEGGSPIGIVQQIEWSLENGIEGQFVIGSDVAANKSIGKSRATGTLTAYFESVVLMNKFINETSSSIDYTLEDLDGNTLTFDFPNVKYNGGQPDVSGDGPITIQLPFVALYDATEQSAVVATRLAAV